MNLQTEYRKARAAHPETSADQCLKMARGKIKRAGWELPQYAGDSVRIELPRGEWITLALEDDHDADIRERLQCDWEDAGDAGDASEGWIARDGRVLWRNDRGWYWWEDGYGFAQFWEDGARMGRHAAYLRARRLVAKSFDYFRTVCEAGYVGYVVTLHDADGKEIDNNSVWGFEATGDYAAEEGYYAALSMAEDRAKHWADAATQARKDMRGIRATLHSLAVELRKARGSVGPAMCDAIEHRIDALRADWRSALRVVIA